MHYHFLGICGTFMGGLAMLAKEMGFKVTGQDQHIYPPMSIALEQAAIPIIPNYEPTPILQQANEIIIGNALSRGNPCIEIILNERLAYSSGPQWLNRYLRSYQVLAVAGTHGKTTTTSMLSWILDYAGLNPGFLIGGLCSAWSYSARLGGGNYFVIEADEYDTAFFDKRAKFLHYRPNIIILNNLEYDHSDIYPNLEAIETQCHHLMRILPAQGSLILPKPDSAIERVLKRGCWSQIQNIPELGYHWQDISLPDTDKTAYQNTDPQINATSKSERPENLESYHLHLNNQPLGSLTWSQKGAHNLNNALGALLAAQAVGVAITTSLQALSSFPGVKRRLELIGQQHGITVYDDFAHHPTAIASTLTGLRKNHKGRLLAVIEPRSNTMKMGIHQNHLESATQAASLVYWLQPPQLPWSLEAIFGQNSRHRVFDHSQVLLETLMQQARPNDRIVFMSNGSFHHLPSRFVTALKEIN